VAKKTVVRRKDIIISAGLAVLIIAGVALIQVLCIMPASAIAKQQKNKVEAAIKKLEDNSKKRRDVEKIEASNKELKTRLAVFDKRVPTRSEIAALVAEVLRSADQNGLRIFQTKPQGVIASGQGFYRFPYELDLQGKYHSVGQFVSEIESHASFMRVQRVDLSGTNEPGVVRTKILIYLHGTANQAVDQARTPDAS
jgi:Tfp pilus assembly protein PilO